MKQLNILANEAQRLGSAMRLVKTARNLYKTLDIVRKYLQDDAKTFGFIIEEIAKAKSVRHLRKKRRRQTRPHPLLEKGSVTSNESSANIVVAFLSLADAVSDFSKCELYTAPLWKMSDKA